MAVYTDFADHVRAYPSRFRDASVAMPMRVHGATAAHLWACHTAGRHTGCIPPSQQDAVPPPPHAVSNGGWPTYVATAYDTTRCNIDRRSNLSVEEFMAEYAGKNRPVIIGGALGGWKAVRAWTRDQFLAAYGDDTFDIRESKDIAYDNEFGGLHKNLMSVREYVELVMRDTQNTSDAADLPYMFGTPQWRTRLRKDFETPAYFKETAFSWNDTERDSSMLAFLGPALSGVTLHEHTNAYNALIYGRSSMSLHVVLILAAGFKYAGVMDGPQNMPSSSVRV
eukprot:m.1463446 g.1463446  ORF g.1463446 m.1463446 type:complete len:281 (-) comp25134_c0_seq65:3735-4577(-)